MIGPSDGLGDSGANEVDNACVCNIHGGLFSGGRAFVNTPSWDNNRGFNRKWCFLSVVFTVFPAWGSGCTETNSATSYKGNLDRSLDWHSHLKASLMLKGVCMGYRLGEWERHWLLSGGSRVVKNLLCHDYWGHTSSKGNRVSCVGDGDIADWGQQFQWPFLLGTAWSGCIHFGEVSSAPCPYRTQVCVEWISSDAEGIIVGIVNELKLFICTDVGLLLALASWVAGHVGTMIGQQRIGAIIIVHKVELFPWALVGLLIQGRTCSIWSSEIGAIWWLECDREVTNLLEVVVVGPLWGFKLIVGGCTSGSERHIACSRVVIQILGEILIFQTDPSIWGLVHKGPFLPRADSSNLSQSVHVGSAEVVPILVLHGIAPISLSDKVPFLGESVGSYSLWIPSCTVVASQVEASVTHEGDPLSNVVRKVGCDISCSPKLDQREKYGESKEDNLHWLG